MSRILSRLTAADEMQALPSVAAKVEASQAGTAPAPPSKPSNTAAMPKPKREKKQSSRPDISESVRMIVANVSGLEPGEIKNDSEFADFGIDSLMGMELAREVETLFKCTLVQTELMEPTNFQKFVKCIEAVLYPANDSAGAREDDEDNDDDNTSENTNGDMRSEDSGSGDTTASSTGSPPAESITEIKGAELFTGSSLGIPHSDILEAFGESRCSRTSSS